MNKCYLVRWFYLGLAIAGLAGCAEYRVVTNKAPDYDVRVNKMFVWSAIGEFEYFARKYEGGNSFEENFHAALKAALSETGVTADVRKFSPKNDRFDQLSRYETEIAPTARLLLVPTRIRTWNLHVHALWIDLSLYDIRTNRRVWRSEVLVDSANQGALFTWSNNGAKKLSEHIVAALKKDDLIAPVAAKIDAATAPK